MAGLDIADFYCLFNCHLNHFYFSAVQLYGAPDDIDSAGLVLFDFNLYFTEQ